jgi:type IV pilus assembly protein PilC
MPTFIYKALKKGETEPYEGTIEAEDRFKVYSLVRKDDAQIISVTEKGKGGKGALDKDVLAPFRRVKEIDRILLTRNLGAMLKAGLSLTRALSVIERQTKSLKLKEVLKDISANIEKGGSLSESLGKHPKVFSNLITSMVAAGEESGTLAESLKTIASQLERAYDLKKKVKGAMIYPTVIVFALLLVGAAMMIFIVPSLTETFKSMDVELPLTTQIVIGISDFLVQNTLYAFLIFCAVIAAFIAAMRTQAGKRVFETVFLRVPVLGTLMKETNSARTGRTLTSLLSSGVNMLTSIEITTNVIQNSHYKDVLNEARKEVEKGQALAKVFIEAEKLYPPLVGELIAVGEETGALPDMLKEIATYYENEVEQKTKNMSTIIEPIMMLLVGGAVGFFAVSMISPIYSITSSIQ